MARAYDEAGADELVMLNITGSREHLPSFIELVRQVCKDISTPVIAGGGLNCLGDVELLLQAGSSRVSLNTAAVRYPELVKEAAEAFGSSSVMVAVDAKKTRENYWEVCIQGGKKVTGRNVLEWVKEVEDLGAGEILLTSVDRDGSQDGYDLELTRRVKEAVKIPVIASGGAGELEHLYQFYPGKADAALQPPFFTLAACASMKSRNTWPKQE